VNTNTTSTQTKYGIGEASERVFWNGVESHTLWRAENYYYYNEKTSQRIYIYKDG
jgi:5-keto 4-deoxyuronate isomerase